MVPLNPCVYRFASVPPLVSEYLPTSTTFPGIARQRLTAKPAHGRFKATVKGVRQGVHRALIIPCQTPSFGLASAYGQWRPRSFAGASALPPRFSLRHEAAGGPLSVSGREGLRSEPTSRSRGAGLGEGNDQGDERTRLCVDRAGECARQGAPPAPLTLWGQLPEGRKP